MEKAPGGPYPRMQVRNVPTIKKKESGFVHFQSFGWSCMDFVQFQLGVSFEIANPKTVLDFPQIWFK